METTAADQCEVIRMLEQRIIESHNAIRELQEHGSDSIMQQREFDSFKNLRDMAVSKVNGLQPHRVAHCKTCKQMIDLGMFPDRDLVVIPTLDPIPYPHRLCGSIHTYSSKDMLEMFVEGLRLN
jgi:hypothetical protein